MPDSQTPQTGPDRKGPRGTPVWELDPPTGVEPDGAYYLTASTEPAPSARLACFVAMSGHVAARAGGLRVPLSACLHQLISGGCQPRKPLLITMPHAEDDLRRRG